MTTPCSDPGHPRGSRLHNHGQLRPDRGHGRGGGEVVPLIAPQPAGGSGTRGLLTCRHLQSSGERRAAGKVGGEKERKLFVAKKNHFLDRFPGSPNSGQPEGL